jgi:hypothetical protein
MASGLSLAALAGIPAAAASAARGMPPPGRAVVHRAGPVTRLGLAGAGAAQAANGRLFTNFAAGYDAGGGRFFRFVSTTVTVPAPSTNAPASQAAVVLSGSGQAAEVFVVAGGGAGSVGFNWTHGTGVIGVAPKVGDQVMISIFFDQHGREFFTAADTTTGISRTVTVNAGSPVYTEADVLAVVDNAKVTAPAMDTRLWAFTGSHLTTYSGVRGTLLGPWVTSEVVDTLTGTASGAVVIDSPVLWNSGQNFGVWLRTTA